MLTYASSSSQVGEIMEIKLVNIANIFKETLTIAKMELVSRVEKRDRGDKEMESVPVLIENIVKVKDVQGRYNALESQSRRTSWL